MKEKLQKFIHFQNQIRLFFTQNNFQEIITPPAVEHPGIEPHIHPFALYSVSNKKIVPKYLHTSPEFKMKELLSYDFKKIFTLAYSFRDEPKSSNHRFQFLMLEWYRANASYTDIMEDSYNLVLCLSVYFDCKKKFENIQRSVSEIFKEILNVDLNLLLTNENLQNYLKINHKDLIPTNISELAKLSWDDLFYLLFLNKIEPQLEKYPFIILKDYPAQLSSLSRIDPNDKRYCQRFEIYMSGLEIGNCFQELTDLDEQRKRFKDDSQLKKSLYHYQINSPPNVLFNSLERGIPQSSGIAVGVERLFRIICNVNEPFIF